MQQCSRHYKKLAGGFQIHFLHRRHIIEKLIGYQADGNVIYIYFIFFNQVKKKVERAFKRLCFYRIW